MGLLIGAALVALTCAPAAIDPSPTTGGSAVTDPTPGPSVVPATPTSAPTAPPDPSTWPLVWSQEFNGPAGTPPDPKVWGYDLGDGSAIGLAGWGNNERERYTDDPANVAADGDGNLRITVLADDRTQACYYGPCEYTSARLLTRGRYDVQFGRIEARIRVPEGFGLWPAFWMLGDDIDAVGWPRSGEIDVMEYLGRRPNEILGTLHGPNYSGSSGITASVDVGEPVANAFHTYAIEWWPGHIGWSFDGVPFHQVEAADVAPDDWVFDHRFFLLLNVAVGGNLGGPVDPNLKLPASMLVDYVRIYQGSAP